MTNPTTLREEIEIVLAKATPGPWQTRFIYRMFRRVRESPGDLAFNTDGSNDWNDSELIASAPDLLRRASAALSAHSGETGPTHRHVSSGNLYRVIGRGHDCTNGQPLRPVVIYEDQTGAVWVRHAPEFDDGRFEAIRGRE